MTDNNPDFEIQQAQQDELGDFSDAQKQQQEDYYFGDYSQKEEKDSIFSFFRRMLHLKDSSKVANLDKKELGMLDLSVRQCEQLAMYGKLFRNDDYRDFFMRKAEITLATSMSKKGWLPELVVSQKRFNQRMVSSPPQQSATGKFLGMANKSEENKQQ